MAELTADATESARILSVDTQGTVGVGYRIGDEQVVLLGQNKPVSAAAWTWTVERAQNGTTAAEHDSGATVATLVDVVGTAAFSTPGSGVEAHGELSGVTADQHHPQLHAAEHAEGEADALSLADLGVSAFAETLLDDADAATARATLGVTAGYDGTRTEATLGADVTMTNADEFYDGPTITPAAGTYDVRARISIAAIATAQQYIVGRLIANGSATPIDEAKEQTAMVSTSTALIYLEARVVADGTNPILVRAAASNAGLLMKRDPDTLSSGIHRSTLLILTKVA